MTLKRYQKQNSLENQNYYGVNRVKSQDLGIHTPLYKESIVNTVYNSRRASNGDCYSLGKVQTMNENLSQSEVNALMEMTKFFVKENPKFPDNGNDTSFELSANNNREKFFLDVGRSGKIELGKTKIQNRHSSYTVLVRLEIDAPPHINPDGTNQGRNHIHIYKEGYEDRWAYNIDEFENASFGGCTCFQEYIEKFCDYCNIKLPEMQTTL